MNNRRFPQRTTVVVVAASPKPEAPVEAAPVAQKKEKQTPRGFGSIYQRGRIWHVGYLHRGKWHRESSHSDNKANAERLLKNRWKEIGKGRFIGPSEDRVTMDDLLEGLKLDYRNNRLRSLPDLEGRLYHLLEAFGGMKAVDVTEDRIERYKAVRLSEKPRRGKRNVCPGTINRELAALRRAFRLGVRQKRIGAAPAISMLEENNVRQGFVEPAEFEAIVENLPEHLKDFSRFAYITACRKGEMQTMPWADVNLEAQMIEIRGENTKNKEPHRIPLVDELGRIIERRLQARVIQNADGSTGLAKFVFHRDGRPIGDFRKAWAVACEKAEKPGLLFHDLRRSGVRNFDRNGVSQPVGMMISGHKTASVYRRYRIVSENDIREALGRVQQGNEREKNQQRRVVPIAEAKKVNR